MFQAIYHSKIRNKYENLECGTSWRKIHKETEDFLTAAIFGRLIYLNPTAIWHIIRNAVISDTDLPDDVGDLETVDFWPRWELPCRYYEKVGSFKEPDVFLRFEKYDLIVEAKLSSSQNAKQWAYEQIAYLEQKSIGPRSESCIFAIGGISNCTVNNLQSIKNSAKKIISSKKIDKELNVIACSWQDLLHSIKSYQNNIAKTQHQIPLPLYRDLINIFAFHGYRTWAWLKDLPKFSPKLSIKKASFDTMKDWFEVLEKVRVPDQWWKLTGLLRTIKPESNRILGRSLR